MNDNIIYFFAGLSTGFTVGALTVILVLKSVIKDYMNKK